MFLLNLMRRRMSHSRCQSIDGSPEHSITISLLKSFGGSEVV